MPRRRPFSLAVLALGNFVVGLSILLPTGMLAELSSIGLTGSWSDQPSFDHALC
jgi:hypothetical protein